MSISSLEQSGRVAARLPEGRPGAVPAREVRHQELVEASFDRAEAHARLGDFDRAVEWLDRAATVTGGLPPAYRAKRARWARSTSVRSRQTGGYRMTRLAQAGAGADR